MRIKTYYGSAVWRTVGQYGFATCCFVTGVYLIGTGVAVLNK